MSVTIDSFWYWQANVGRGVGKDEFVRNVKTVINAAGPTGFIFWQEVDEADKPEEADIIVDLTHKTHRMVGGNTAVPIMVPKDLDVENQRQTLACRGLAKYTPSRVINETKVELWRGTQVGMLNTHLPLNRPQTLTRRREVREQLKVRARRHDSGLWVADTNTHVGWPTIVRGEKSAVSAGIDKGKVWAGWKQDVHVVQRSSRNLTIDGHNAHGARVKWITHN